MKLSSRLVYLCNQWPGKAGSATPASPASLFQVTVQSNSLKIVTERLRRPQITLMDEVPNEV